MTSEIARDRFWHRVYVDVILSTCGIAFGWASVTFPFGRDQGRFYYVAREWLLRGSIPYRDVVDDQTPGIYALHAIAVALFGQVSWGIRLLDLACVVSLGWIAAACSGALNTKVERGVSGAAVLATSIFYYGFSDFWNTAQLEIWVAMLSLASLWAARRIRGDAKAQFIAGVFGSLALIVKPSAIPFVAFSLVLSVWRVWSQNDGRISRVALGTLTFFAGLLIPIAVTCAYFSIHGALGNMIEMVVDASGYIGRESSVHGLGAICDAMLFGYRSYFPIAPLLFGLAVISAAVFHRRNEFAARDRHLLGLVLICLSVISVVIQQRFYAFHWVVLVGPYAVIAANVIVDIPSVTSKKDHGMQVRAIAGALFFLAWIGSGDPRRNWLDENKSAAAWIAGRIDRATFAGHFSNEALRFSEPDNERVAAWLRAHTDANDSVAVRGFEPEIYALSGCHFDGRFFYTAFLTSPARIYNQAPWLAEDAATLDAHPPRFVVTISDAHSGPDAAETFEAKGYESAAKLDSLEIMERRP